MTEGPDAVLTKRCCVVGGGPAGMMLGLLLARGGVDVVVLEKHADFLRDFRGDTIHPSTMEVLGELGLLEDFATRPFNKAPTIAAYVGGKTYRIADFRHLPVRCPFIALMPQWDFLDMLADHARLMPNFDLRMRTEATDLIEEDGVVRGVRATTPEGRLEIRADLVVGCDGRHSTLRERSGLPLQDIGAPIDVLWFRVPRTAQDPQQTMGAIGPGGFLALIERGDYWQCGFVIRKGGSERIHTEGIGALRARLKAIAPVLAPRFDTLESFDQVKLLSVTVDRLTDWARAGLLCIGDAAHAMSPVGGIGINLAIQDAVAAANILAPALKEGPADLAVLRQVQERREPPTRRTQKMQVFVQDKILGPIVSSTEKPSAPLFLRVFNALPILQRIPARVIGMGFLPEHVRPELRASAEKA